jgi:hypothetical protein
MSIDKYINEDISYCKIQNPIIDNKKVTHIIVIDNDQIKKDLNPIINEYPFMLNKYINSVNVENLYLISNYPKVTVTKFDATNYFTKFRKIIYNKRYTYNDSDTYELMIENCLNIIEKDISEIKEINIFCNLKNNKLTKKTTDYMNILAENYKVIINLIRDDAFNNYVNINDFVCDVGISVKEFYKNIILSGLLFSAGIKNNLVNIKLEGGTLFGTNISTINVDTISHKNILINNSVEKVMINDINYEIVQHSENNFNDILDGIYFILKNNIELDIKSDVFIKNKLINFINLKDHEEVKHKATIIYQEFKKKSFGKIKNTLDTIDLDNENIKIIIEYGKKSLDERLKLNNNLITNNINSIVKTSDITNKIKKFVDDHENSENIKFLESCEFFNSPITLSNWFEELSNDNCIGLLINLESNGLAKMGFNCHDIKIQNITNSYLSVIDFINMSMEFFNKSGGKFGNLNNKTILDGMAIGKSNAVIPIYINKYHWIVVNKYLNPLLGTIVSHNPFNFNKKHKSIYYTIFIDMTKKLFDNEKKHLNSNYIKTYIAMLRTCAEICFENKYNHGIRKLVNSYLSNCSVRMNISKDKFPYDKLCSQIIVTGYIIPENDMKSLIQYLVEEIIRTRVKIDNYENTYIDYIASLDDKQIESDIDSLIFELNNRISNYDIQSLVSFYKINNLMKEIINIHGSYSKFIKQLEDDYGLLNDKTCDKIMNIVSNNLNNSNYKIEELYNYIGINFNRYNILWYIISGIKSLSGNDYIDAQKQVIDLPFIKSQIIKIEN